MSNWITLQIDTEPLKEGKFYKLMADKNGTIVLTETMTIKDYEFQNIRYFECPEPYDGYSGYKIWEKIESNGIKRFLDITSGCEVLKTERDGKYYISFSTNKIITGHIQFL